MTTTPQSSPKARRPHGLLGSLACALLGAALLQSPSAVAETGRPAKLAVVDMQRAVLETEDGLRAQATLRKFFDRKQSELNARQEELGRRKEELERQSKVLSKDALQRAMEDVQKQMNDLQAVYQDYNRDLQKRQSEITAPIFARVSGLLRKIAQRDGYDMILERQAVPYSRADLDLTDALIVMYNGGEDSPSGAPAPTAPPPSGAPPAAPAPAPSSSAPRL